MKKTGKFHIKTGQIYCFEKKHSRYKELLSNLVGATSRMDDICSYFRTIRPNVLNGKKNIGFPSDVINLDFEGSLCKLKVSLEETIDNIISCQSKFQKEFALFLTFPQSEDTDTEEYKQNIVGVVQSNIDDNINSTFKDSFHLNYDNVDSVEYEILHVIGLVKQIIKCTSINKYQCSKYDSIIYGDKELKPGSRKRMHSLLFIFSPISENVTHTDIYYQDIQKAFQEATSL